MVVELPEPRVMEEPGRSVWPEMTTPDEPDAAATVTLPTTVSDGVPVGGLSVELDPPTTTTVRELLFVCKATMVVEVPEPMVTEDPGTSVWPETTSTDDESDACETVTPPTTVGDVLLASGTVDCAIVLSKSAVPVSVVCEDKVDGVGVGAVDCAGVALAAGDALDDVAAVSDIVVVDVAKIPPACAWTPTAPAPPLTSP
jgi:hypothetical protein